MKVVMVGPVYPFRGGIAHHVTSLSSEFSKNHSTDVISFKNQYPSWLYPGVSDQDPSQEITQTEAAFILSPLNPLSWRNSFNLIREIQPECIILHWWVAPWSLAYRHIAANARKLGISVLYMVHNTLPHEQRFGDKFLTKLALSHGDGFVFHNETQEKALKRLYPEARTVISPLPNFDFIKPMERSRSMARSLLNLPLDQIMLLFFGIVRPYKGLTVLIEALAKLSSRDQQPFLVIAGEFWEPVEKYQLLIEEYRLTENVIIVNKYIPNEELGNYLMATNVLVAPYTGGTQSASLALAMGFGLPAIASEHIIAGADLPDGSVIASIQPGDSTALAEAITKLISQKDLIWKEPAHHPGDWGKLVQAFERLYSLTKNR